MHVCCQMTQKGEGREKGRQWSVLLVRGAGGKDESLPSVPTGGRSGRVLTLSGCGGISTSRAAFGILGRNEEGGAPGGYDGGDARGGGVEEGAPVATQPSRGGGWWPRRFPAAAVCVGLRVL